MTRVARLVQQEPDVVDLPRFENGALDPQFADRFGGIRNRRELDADHGAARRGLRLSGGPRVPDRLGGLRQHLLEQGAVRDRLHPLQLPAAERTCDEPPHDLPQGFEFQNFSAGDLHVRRMRVR